MTTFNSSAQSRELHNVRSWAVFSHPDGGKSSFSAAAAYLTGRTYKVGSIDTGTNIMDSMKIEQERGVTISAAATSWEWKNHFMNVGDTPGHLDWALEVMRFMRVVEGGVALYDAAAGVEPQSEAVWRLADQYGVSRIGFANKMDKIGADMAMTINSMRERLGANAHAIQLPIGAEDTFTGVIDLVRLRALYFDGEHGEIVREEDIPTQLAESAEVARHALIEALAEVDDVFMEQYFAGEDSEEHIRAALRRVTIARTLIPVLCGSAYKNIGVQPVLDAINDYLPSPLDVPAVEGVWDEQVETRAASVDEPFSALIFKLQRDLQSGQMLNYARIYSGRLRVGDKVVNAITGKTERIGRLVRMHSNKQEPLEEASAGAIVAIVGLKTVKTGHTICDPAHPIVLESMDFPEPVISQAIEPKNQAAAEQLSKALQSLADEDPSFVVKTDEETGQTVISGMGELHLEVLVDRMLREFRVDATVGNPQVAYREAITQKADGIVGKIKQQSGGSGQYAQVVISIEPTDEDFVFVNAVKGGSVPSEYINAVEQGARDASKRGVLASYPMTGIKVTLTDGDSHDVDSSEMAFRRAAAVAVQAAVKAAGPVILEPWMKVNVVMPADGLGDVMGDLMRRRGRVEGQEPRGVLMSVDARVPLESMFGYATDVRTMTQGRGQYTMEIAEYEQLPKHKADELITRG